MNECQECSGTGVVNLICSDPDQKVLEKDEEEIVLKSREVPCKCQLKLLGKAKFLLGQWIDWRDSCGMRGEAPYAMTRSILGMEPIEEHEAVAKAARIADRKPDVHGYGYCPTCDEPGVRRRHTNGKTYCLNNHEWIPDGYTRPSDEKLKKMYSDRQKK